MKYQFDFSFLVERWPDFLYGVLLTVEMTAIAVIMGAFFGTLCAVAHTGKVVWLRRIVSAYIEIIRNTPLLIQTFWLFFGLAAVLRLTAFQAAVGALTVNVTAYSSEIIRAGIESIHKGQVEAAESLGLSRVQMLVDVILPPAIEKVIPALTSQFVLMMLASSIMCQISAEELTAVGGRIMLETFRGLEIYIVIAGIYVVLSLLLRLVFRGVAYVAFPRKRRLKARG
jgi:polar amino acid transport system permease protein